MKSNVYYHNLNQWSGLFSSNENICIFLMPDLDTASINQLLERTPHWQFLLTRMFARNDRPSDQMIYVGPPRKDEVENLFHYFRLKNRLKTDWLSLSQAIISVTRNLCSKGEENTLQQIIGGKITVICHEHKTGTDGMF